MYKGSLAKGKMTKDWKRVEIVPLYKGGSKADPLNYRPVSLTSVVVKVCPEKDKEQMGVIFRE